MLWVAFNMSDEVANLERLYSEHKKVMLNRAYQILKNYHLAEDAVQQSFLRILHYSTKIDADDSRKARNILCIICRNVCYDIIKANSNEVSYDEVPSNISYTEDTLDVIINIENAQRISDTIKALNPIYADVVILKHSHGFTYGEIAAMLKISEATARKRYERARKMLAESLSTEVNDDDK